MRAINPKTLHFSDIEDEKVKRIWVLNSTRDKNADGPVIFTVSNETGQGVSTVEIPLTWIPLDLTNQVSKSQLMSSSYFKRAVNRGLLRLIDEDSASQILNQPGADEEIEKINDLRRQVGASLTSMNVTNEMGDIASKTQMSPQNTYAGTETSDVNPTVFQLMMDATENPDIKDIQLINSLRTIRTKLTDKDFRFIMTEAQKLNRQDLIEWVEQETEEAA